MFKLTVVVVLLVIGSCLAVTFDELREQFDENKDFDVAQANRQELDDSQGFDETTQEFDETTQEFDDSLQEFDETTQEFDDSQDFDDSSEEFDESQEFDSELDTTSEDEVVNRHVRHLDAAREALIEFARGLRKGKNITNAFLKVVDGFEKQIADFQAALGRRKVKPDLVEKLKQFIEEAAKDRKANTIILRTLTAQGLFLAQKSDDRPRAKRDALLLEGATAFLESIREDIGEEAFEEYLSVSGLVTLMFVIDDTGSMAGDIKAAISIATQIVRLDRDFEVDYILSPFNDPGTGPITVKDETQGEEFVTALGGLRAHAGGDCPELAFKGMIDALESGPQPGSAMYVFTDASPKDATPENIDNVIELAHDLLVPINFFTRGNCRSGGDPPAFTQVATDTGGLVYPLQTTAEIRELGRLVSDSLRGSASIGSGGSGTTTGRRRRATGSEYSISVDDSIEKILITVTTQNSGATITLVNPTGKIITVGRLSLTKGVLYEISNPVPGVYMLDVSISAGHHTYRVNAVSSTNIDFGHYYTYIPRRGRNRVPIPIEQPLEGVTTTVFITVAGAESVTSSSLIIKVVNSDGTVHKNQALQPVGTSGVRYTAKFLPPLSGPFKLQIHGKTRKGNPFMRTSLRLDQAAPVIIRQSYKRYFNTLPRAKTTTLRIQIQRGKVCKNVVVTYTVTLKDSRYGKVLRPSINVRCGRIGFARIVFTVPADAPKGKSEPIKIHLTRKGETKLIASLSIPLLVV